MKINEEIRKMIAALQGLGPVAKPMGVDANLLKHYGKIRCKCCNKDYDSDQYKLVNTGYIVATDGACLECRKTAKDCCPIVCVRCKDVVARSEPYTDQDGFKFEKNRAYHVDACPDCVEGGSSSMVVEKKIFIREKYK
jgi:hypothetical protein